MIARTVTEQDGPKKQTPKLGAFAKLQKVTISLVMFVCSSVRPTDGLSVLSNSAPTGQIYIKFNI